MIDMHPPPAYIQIAQKPTPGAGQPLQLMPSQPPQPPAAPAAAAQSQPQPPASDSQPEQIEVTPLDVGRYLPPTATYATIIVTVVPPTGTVEIYTPGSEDSPVIFRGPKTAGEIRLNGPTAYVRLKNGATSYEVEYLSWREP
ncbi:MAG TPA: hypothetical protein VK337_02465 [Xanthobacteraceae bacterium]|nr:hypothetical protein [Xanthobacteraceae bacterium]